jgi:hypothetical protein
MRTMKRLAMLSLPLLAALLLPAVIMLTAH